MNFKVFRNLVLFFSYIILGFFLFIIIPWGIYGFYLDLMIKNRINGKIWNLPTIIYGRTINLEPNMILSKNSMVNLLQAIQYRKVSKITRSGEFIVHDDSIELVRRFFSFPNGLKEEAHVFLFFKKEKLIQIYNKKTKRDFGLFCLDPRIISILYSPNRQQRLFLPKSEFPDTLINMLLAIEDRYFYQHDGIKLSSIGRAFLKNIIAKKTVQGGSTLTQQLVKNLFLTNEKSLWRKFNEIYMALILNQRCSKDRILELYLNEIYFGQNGDDQIRGFPLASFYYFGRPVSELSLDQQAMLVGMIKGASLYNPWKNPQITLERRNLILKLLNKQKIINSDLYNTLVLRSMGVQSKDIASISQPAFTEIVCAEVNSTLDNFYQNFSGMKVFTTLDSVSQESAEKAMVHGITQLRNYYNINDLEGAIIVVDRFTGELRATVSGFNLHFSGFNRVLNARRSIGSLIKPAICLAALSNPNKFHLNTWISGKPIVLKQSTGVLWSPKNYNRKFCEKVTLIDSLIKSINVPIVRLGLSIGLSSISDFLIKLGVQPYLISTFPSILLGSINLTPMEVAQKFQTIASGGKRSCLSTVNYITDENNIILFKNFIKTERVVSPQASYLTLYAMQQASIKGTSRVLFSEFSHLNIAGKTGTTNDLRDSWFVGIDGREVVVIWVGRDNNASTKLTGSSGALELYRLYLKYQNNVLPLNLVPPIGIFEISSWEYENFFSLDEKNINKNDVLPIWVSDFNLLNIYSRK